MKTIGVILAILVIGGGILFYVNSNNYSSQQQPSKTEVPKVADTQSAATVSDSTSGFDKRFVSYSAANLEKATKNGKAVVFFHASWCPLCSEAEADLKSNWEKVPSDVTILKTDYDSSKELKTKYGIVSQDTWVQVDALGAEITKWNSGGKGLQTLLANLK